MTKVVLTKLFLSNLIDILNYIENDNSAIVADKIENSIMNAIELLECFPHYGRTVVNSKGEEIMYLFIVGNYHIIYEYNDNVVYVHDVFDCRRDPSNNRY